MRIALVAAASLGLAWPAAAGETFVGSAALNADKVVFAHGVATWSAGELELALGLFDAPPLGAERPYLLVELVFAEGTTTASPKAMLGCHLGFYGFKDGPFDYNGNTGTCGVSRVTGDLKDGGLVTGELSGRADIAPMGPIVGKTVDWTVRFSATLRASDASVEMEGAVGPRSKVLPAGGGEIGKAFAAERCTGRGLMGMANCRILGGREDGDVAFVSVEADTMGTRMRNDFLLRRKSGAWTVEKEGAWRGLP